jgi:REP element-mobilizing transposase RayT
MSTFVSNLVHFVWGTANREPLLRKSWRNQLHKYIGGVLVNKKAKMLAAGGMEDHMHVLASLPATISLSEAASARRVGSVSSPDASHDAPPVQPRRTASSAATW